MTTPAVHVITILSLPQSMEASARCLASAAAHGLEARIFPAFTPVDDPVAIFRDKGWPTAKFTHNRYSRPLPCMACFASHAELWRICVSANRPLIVCEHDAVWVRPLPSSIHDGAWIVNLGKPSFGKWKQPPCGIGPLVSGPHFKGAHAYLIRPQGARELLRLAQTEAEPVDVFLSAKRFPLLRECFPYPAECRATFSTVQRAEGCAAKHDKVEII